MEYHLWREFSTPPFQRYAVTLREAKTPDGFEIVDHDPIVADGVFMAGLADHLRKPASVDFATREGDTILEQNRVAQPGEPGHLASAVRSMPIASLRSVGRA